MGFSEPSISPTISIARAAGGAATRIRVGIAGAGAVTSLGISLAETWQALLEGKFITDHSRAAGEFGGPLPRVITMSIRAAKEALAEAGWSELEIGKPPGVRETQVQTRMSASLNPPASDIALIVGTSKGSIESWISPLPATADNGEPTGGRHRPSYQGHITPSGLADVGSALAEAIGLHGARLTVSAACASGLVALIRGAMLIESGQARRVLVVAGEASLHPLFLGSFKRLGVLPSPGVGCRPFDLGREGFLMSEAAAAVCLEAIIEQGDEIRPKGIDSDHPSSHSARVMIDGYAMGADGSHLTAADPDGRVLRHCIYKVLAEQGDRGVDLVHAHGTGTVANDPVELRAIEAAMALQPATLPPCLYSHKGALGHSLGAAGLMSIVLSRLMHQTGIVLGNVRTTAPLPSTGVTIAQRLVKRSIQRSIALAAGFGGATAAVGLASAG